MNVLKTLDKQIKIYMHISTLNCIAIPFCLFAAVGFAGGVDRGTCSIDEFIKGELISLLLLSICIFITNYCKYAIYSRNKMKKRIIMKRRAYTTAKVSKTNTTTKIVCYKHETHKKSACKSASKNKTPLLDLIGM